MAKQSVFDAPLALGLPSKDKDVLTAKRLFNQLGRLTEPPRGFSNRFDQPLDDTVRAFQRDSGILEDGLINPGGATERNIRRERGELPNEPPLDPVELDISAPIGNGLENRPEDIIGISKLLGRMGLLKFDKTREPSPIISTRLVNALKELQRQHDITPTGDFKPGDKTDAVLKAEADKMLGKNRARGRFDLDAVSKSANKREDEISARHIEDHARDPRRRSGRLLDTLEDARDSARRRNDARDLKNPDRDIFDENDEPALAPFRPKPAKLPPHISNFGRINLLKLSTKNLKERLRQATDGLEGQARKLNDRNKEAMAAQGKEEPIRREIEKAERDLELKLGIFGASSLINLRATRAISASTFVDLVGAIPDVVTLLGLSSDLQAAHDKTLEKRKPEDGQRDQVMIWLSEQMKIDTILKDRQSEEHR